MEFIEGLKDITCENPTKEIWKLLRFFKDTPSVSNRIRSIHGVHDDEFKRDINKQAQQIGYCIQQAEEYFHASSQVGLPTRPLLLYYGVVSLSQALVLLWKDGSHSLDARRKNQKHKHHGLEQIGEITCNDVGMEDLLCSIKCRCHIKNDMPWGQFALFYQSLAPSAFLTQLEIHDFDKSGCILSEEPHPCADLLPLNSLISNKINMLDLIKTLPDMYFISKQLGIQPELCRGDAKCEIIQHYKQGEKGNKKIDKIKETWDYSVDGMMPYQKEHLLAFYGQKNPSIKLLDDLGSNMHLRSIREFAPDKDDDYYFPDIVEDINGRKFYILKPEAYVSEPAAYYMILYCLGMLSRYSPDIWMKATEKYVQFAEYIDSLLNISFRKYPNLILDQLTLVKHYVHI